MSGGEMTELLDEILKIFETEMRMTMESNARSNLRAKLYKLIQGYDLGTTLISAQYQVKSFTTDDLYIVTRGAGDEWSCTCKAYMFGQGKMCKHILAVQQGKFKSK